MRSFSKVMKTPKLPRKALSVPSQAWPGVVEKLLTTDWPSPAVMSTPWVEIHVLEGTTPVGVPGSSNVSVVE